MTLATRCSACGTSFRVVQDQLKVSGGWVRCGRCNEVFNALEGLYEIYTQPGELGTGQPQGLGSSTPTAPTPPQAPTAPAKVTQDQPLASSAREPAASVRSTWPRAATSDSSTGAEANADPGHARRPSEPEPAEPTLGPRGQGADSAPFFGEVHSERHEPLARESFDDVETRLEPRPGEEGGPTPSFMRQGAAAQAQAGTRTGQRGLWLFLTLLAAAGLAAQTALAYRDLLAAYQPRLRFLLDQVCEPLGCKVQPLRRMTALSVEGSNLRQRGAEGTYELLVNLRNRAETPVLLPAFELTLTDTQGQPLVRRVLRAHELGARGETIAAGAELSLQAALDVSDRRIAGYTVEIFYP